MRSTTKTLALVGMAITVGVTDAHAAGYVATPADGGRIVLNVNDGRLVRVRAALPARCDDSFLCDTGMRRYRAVR